MPEESTTSVVISKLDILTAELRRQNDKVNEVRNIQIENCGRDGRNGKFLQLRNDVGEMEKSISTNQRAIEQLMRQQEKHGVKLTILVTGAATVATMVGGLLLKYLGG